MYFKYDYLPQRYFTPERCLPVRFKKEIVDNDFEFVSCNRLTRPNRYFYYDSNLDMMFHQYIMKSSLGGDLTPDPSPIGPLLRSHESTLVGLALKESKKPFAKWRCIFPIKTGYYMLYNFEQSYRTAFDLLMGKFGIEDYQIYYAKKLPHSYSDESREYILHFSKDSEEAQFIFYFSKMFGDSSQNFDPAKFDMVLDMRLLGYPTLRSLWTDAPNSYGQNVIVR